MKPAAPVPSTVAVRPRLDHLFDVIQSRAPQFVGTRATRAEAVALAEWAASTLGTCVLTVFGPDGATPEEQRTLVGRSPPPRAREPLTDASTSTRARVAHAADVARRPPRLRRPRRSRTGPVRSTASRLG